VVQTYADIGRSLQGFDFEWKQGSVYTCDNEDLANLVMALNALKALPWFPESVRDIRAFRVEQWSDFTAFMRS
jgi:virulence-associated protein VapD